MELQFTFIFEDILLVNILMAQFLLHEKRIAFIIQFCLESLCRQFLG
jgi:hypothetical protein